MLMILCGVMWVKNPYDIYSLDPVVLASPLWWVASYLLAKVASGHKKYLLLVLGNPPTTRPLITYPLLNLVI